MFFKLVALPLITLIVIIGFVLFILWHVSDDATQRKENSQQ